jgi:hypothetical protein
MRPLLMLAETSIVSEALDGCKHLSDSFNRRPRKRLGRKCAWEAFRSRRFSERKCAVKPTDRPRKGLFRAPGKVGVSAERYIRSRLSFGHTRSNRTCVRYNPLRHVCATQSLVMGLSKVIFERSNKGICRYGWAH